MSSYLVRPATARDVKAVRELARRGRREVRLSVRSSDGIGSGAVPELLWVVEAGRGEIVGCCGVRETGPGEWELHTLYLGPEWRGFGLGRALLDNAVRAVQQEGGLEIRFVVSPEALQAVALARQLGFVDGPAGARDGSLLVLPLARAS